MAGTQKIIEKIEKVETSELPRPARWELTHISLQKPDPKHPDCILTPLANCPK